MAPGVQTIQPNGEANYSVAVAEACAPSLRSGSYFLDFNSASPGAKQRAAAAVYAAGGCYVEGAVMPSAWSQGAAGSSSRCLSRLCCVLTAAVCAAFFSDKKGAPFLSNERV